VRTHLWIAGPRGDRVTHARCGGGTEISTTSNDGSDALPSPTYRVTGLRAAERDRVVALLEDGRRLVTIAGLGGIGKSMLALDVVDALRARRPTLDASVLSVGAAGGSGVRDLVFDALRGPGEASEPASGADADDAAAAEPRLVVLDGGEHLLDDADELEAVLATQPGMQLLVTSRVALGTPSETVVPLHGLSTAADGDGVRLFSALAGEHGVELAPADGPRVRELVARLGGYPLAIRLCVIRLQTRPLEEVHGLVVDAGSHGGHDDPSLREVIGWSLQRQSPEAIRLLTVVSTFAGWATLDAIEGVAAELAREPDAPPRRPDSRTLWLAELVDAGLVEVEEASPFGEPVRRYRVHDSVREAARAHRVADEPAVETLAAAHRTWFARRAAELAEDVTTRYETRAFEQLHVEFAEFAVALDAFIETDAAGVLHIANRTGEFFVTRGRIRTGARLLRRALQRLGADEGLVDEPADVELVLARSWLAHMRMRTGAHVMALDYQRWLAELLRRRTDEPPTREVLMLAVHLCFAALGNREYEEALELGARFRDLAVRVGDDYHAGLIDFFLSRLADQAGDPEAAARLNSSAIAHVRRTENEPLLARCVSQSVLLAQGRLTPAEQVERLTPLPDIHLRHRSFKDAALISIPLAIAHQQTGDPAASLAVLRRTLDLSRRIHFFDGQMYAVVLIAFAELSATSTPENIARCARLYGSVRPYLPRFYAVTPPQYHLLLESGIQGLRLMVGEAALERMIAEAPLSWDEAMTDADAFAAELIDELTTDATADTAERVGRIRAELNDRERELLELVLTGITDKQIAARLELRPNTVRSYNSRLFKKFGVASRSELLALIR